jgi:hypothetical protein
MKGPHLFVTAAAILGILACLAALLGILAFVFIPLRAHPAYRLGMDLVKDDPAVLELLGSPVKEGLFVTGTVRGFRHGGNIANLEARISGPWARGQVFIFATEDDAGTWHIESITVRVGDEDALSYRGSEPEKGFH